MRDRLFAFLAFGLLCNVGVLGIMESFAIERRRPVLPPSALPVQPSPELAGVDVPCSPYQGQPSPFLRPCGDVLSGVPEVGTYKGSLGVVPNLEKQIQLFTRGGYEETSGTISKVQLGEVNSVCSLEMNSSFLQKACNVFASPLNRVPGTADAGPSCGIPLKLTSRTSVPWICGSGCTYNNSNAFAEYFSVTIDVESSTLDPATGKKFGSLEASYLAGGWIQALSCYIEEVKVELLTQSRLMKIAPQCQEIANSLKTLSKNATDATGKVSQILSEMSKEGASANQVLSQLIQNLSQSSAGNKQNQEIWKCDQAWLESLYGKDYAASGSAGDLRQSAQHLCAARAGIEAVFKQLTVCETIARTSDSYHEVLPSGTTTIFADIISKIRNNEVQRTCAESGDVLDSASLWSSCKEACLPEPTRTAPAACEACLNPKLTSGMRNCYQRWMPEYFRRLFERYERTSSHPHCGDAV